MARERMTVLYDRSVTWGGLVVGTSNKTESLIGYTTLFGDAACAFNPIGDLYKSQVRQVAASIGVPDQIIRKAPSADLWPGQTDESEADFSYPVLDRLLYWRVDRRRTDEEVAALGFDPALVARVDRLIATSEFKRQVPPIAKLGTVALPVLAAYPASTTSIRGGGPVPLGGDRRRRGRACVAGRARPPVCRRDADREPRRYHPPGARRPPVRRAHRRGGHAANPPAPRSASDRDTLDELSRPQRAGPDA